MSEESGTQHQGIFIENGSGGFMSDLTFYGGLNGAAFGNQQFTMRNLTFYNSVTAITQIWDWGWTYKSISINNCSVGLNMSAGGPASQTVGSITFLDSIITDTPIGFVTAYDSTSSPATGGSLILDNVALSNVPIAVQGPGKTTVLAGGSLTISGFGEGHEYTPNGPTSFEGSITPFTRPGALLAGSNIYERSKPSYAGIAVGQVSSTRSAGAKGDGSTDDTAGISQTVIRQSPKS